MNDDNESNTIAKVGQKVKGSNTGQPIMILFDLLGRRWAMGIIWNLNDQNYTFRELQDKCDSLSPTVLNTRLKELRAANLIEKAERGYTLTSYGKTLFDMLKPLGDWSYEWTEMLMNYHE